MLLLNVLLGLILFTKIEGGSVSSFYAPLFPYKIKSPDSNMEVSLYETIPIKFDPEHGKRLRERFEEKYGTRGENLIRNFGMGVKPGYLDNYYELNRILKSCVLIMTSHKDCIRYYANLACHNNHFISNELCPSENTVKGCTNKECPFRHDKTPNRYFFTGSANISNDGSAETRHTDLCSNDNAPGGCGWLGCVKRHENALSIQLRIPEGASPPNVGGLPGPSKEDI